MIVDEQTQLRTSDFDFDLPNELIAQEPSPERDQSRLLVLDRKTGSLEHKRFLDITSILVPGDVLVMNDTKVFPCRLPATKKGGGKAEIFLLAERAVNVWEALVGGAGKAGSRLYIETGIEAEIMKTLPENIKLVRFHGVRDIREHMPSVGRTPLPPYIKRDATANDLERYQTVYAEKEGAVAAPTAGLHFTRPLLQQLFGKGVELVTVTLHVGPGTFLPIKVEKIEDHRMLPEQYAIPHESAEKINRAKSKGRRVIAVGTTSVRTVESAAVEDGTVSAGKGSSELFIYPGYRFKVVDGLITNFHLPKSTLFMLVSAFAGKERMREAYRVAIQERYRFYSYGDAMVIL